MGLTGIFPIDRWNFDTKAALDRLSEADFLHLSKNRSTQRYEKGDIIFRERAVPSGVFIIRIGKVKKYKVDVSGKEQVIYIAGEGELIGYHAVLSNDRYPDSAAALENAVLDFIPKEDFMDTLQRSPLFARLLLKAMSREFSVLTNSISVLAHRSASERLAIALIILREKYKPQGPHNESVINISRTDLANIAGVAKENVIRLLKEFKSADVLQTHGRKIWIKDIHALIERTNYR
ncbi:Crp/Fnr family transcriptional regulator [Olivibacter sp. CPCC 100613]|uniref:Crp/Fnr family transcriptional regulator n=1 Tax=Olivibacter sp. CPCC 100613 TaxID=3079931 RepID=UPI002FFB6E20